MNLAGHFSVPFSVVSQMPILILLCSYGLNKACSHYPIYRLNMLPQYVPMVRFQAFGDICKAKFVAPGLMKLS